MSPLSMCFASSWPPSLRAGTKKKPSSPCGLPNFATAAWNSEDSALANIADDLIATVFAES